MVFSSVVFLLYFLPIFLATYFLVGKKYKNIVILLFSIFFYAWGAPKFIFVILGTTLLDFFLVQLLWNAKSNLQRRIMVTLSISVNIGLLFYFKYSNFFVENLNLALKSLGIESVMWTKLILPIGISFYTFETITYVVDVYRRVHPPLKNFWDYQLYIILFPKLIAGPIIRFHDLADQITDRSKNDSIDNRLTGFYRFGIGLAKKVLIANYLGLQADSVFSMDFSTISSSTAWIGILAYSFQIYFDFSGYSDMAIGIAKIIGFKFPENFNNPYVSQSISEFWRRWHMSLGAWMRSYLYIPLGGNRVDSKIRLYFNLWIVFLASGLWHGASWSFIIWGAFHGFFLVLERAFLLKIYKRIGKFPSTVITFILVMVAWVFFRVEEVASAWLYVTKMFSFSAGIGVALTTKTYIFLGIAFFFAFFAYTKKGSDIQETLYFKEYTDTRHIIVFCVIAILFILSVSSITASGFNPFIYFRF